MFATFWGACACAQSTFPLGSNMLLQKANCWEIVWESSPFVFATNSDGILAKCKAGEQSFYFWLATCGALLAFEDSSLSLPIRVEKKNEYPFHPWIPGKKYELYISRCTDGQGMIGCRWIDSTQGTILDEIWICHTNGEDPVELVYRKWLSKGNNAPLWHK